MADRGWHFFLRKLHSLSGIVPIGAFLLEHLITNSFATKGAAAYDAKVEWILSFPYLLVLEAGFIWAPILYHGVYGLVVTATWKDNSLRYSYYHNMMYAFQRVSGTLTFLFIAYHMWHFRIRTALYGIPVNFELVRTALVNPWVMGAYIVGVAATVFHFSNGIWNFLVTWGVTVGPKAQRISSWVCVGIGLVLLWIGMDSLFAFIR